MEQEIFLLPEPEREVVGLRYGFADGREWEVNEIAVFMGKTRQEIKDILAKGMVELKEFIDDPRLLHHI